VKATKKGREFAAASTDSAEYNTKDHSGAVKRSFALV